MVKMLVKGTWTGLLESFSDPEGIRRVIDLEPQWICYPLQFQDGDGFLGLGDHQRGKCYILHRPQGHLLSDLYPPGLSTITLLSPGEEGLPG